MLSKAPPSAIWRTRLFPSGAVEVRPGTEQPVVEDPGRFQVVRGESDIVDTENLRRRSSGECSTRDGLRC